MVCAGGPAGGWKSTIETRRHEKTIRKRKAVKRVFPTISRITQWICRADSNNPVNDHALARRCENPVLSDHLPVNEIVLWFFVDPALRSVWSKRLILSIKKLRERLQKMVCVPDQCPCERNYLPVAVHFHLGRRQSERCRTVKIVLTSLLTFSIFTLFIITVIF